MEYRQLPNGTEAEKFSVLGLGMGGIHQNNDAEIEKIVTTALNAGINFFDMCAGGKNVYAPFGRAIAGKRDQVFFEMHLGTVYGKNGEYAWSRDLTESRNMFEWELQEIGTDYADIGFLHCVDELEDFDKLKREGFLDYLCEMKRNGVIHHIGFSSHTPAVAERIIDTGLIDLMLFSINPAYDFEKGDELGFGSVRERMHLFQRCQKDKVGISVMKPFQGGKLLDAQTSPFGRALTHVQCLQYAIDRPGVLTVCPGVRSMSDLSQILQLLSADESEKDYSIISEFTPKNAIGSCVYCNHCQPCPAGIDIGLINKYYDLAVAGDHMAYNHYSKLAVNADACLQCGHCNERCPFGVDQMSRMKEIDSYFTKG